MDDDDYGIPDWQKRGLHTPTQAYLVMRDPDEEREPTEEERLKLEKKREQQRKAAERWERLPPWRKKVETAVANIGGGLLFLAVFFIPVGLCFAAFAGFSWGMEKTASALNPIPTPYPTPDATPSVVTSGSYACDEETNDASFFVVTGDYALGYSEPSLAASPVITLTRGTLIRTVGHAISTDGQSFYWVHVDPESITDLYTGDVWVEWSEALTQTNCYSSR